MKRNNSVIVAIVLAVCMLFKLTVVTAQTADNTTAETYYNAVRELNTLGLMDGYTDGGFGENVNIKRAELAALLERLLKPDGSRASVSFADVDQSHWAYNSILKVASAGIMEGYGNGMFAPEEFVKFEEAVKIVVEILADANGIEQNPEYPFGYILKAAEWGITAGVDGAACETAPRGMVARMLLNALYSPLFGDRTLADEKLKGVYYLSPGGDDANGGSYQKPWKTLYKAAATVGPGETVVLLAGQYSETAETVLKTKQIKLCGKMGERVRIIRPADAGIKIRANDVVLKNLEFVFDNSVEAESTGEQASFIECSGNGAVISECEFKGFSVPVLITGAKDVKMEKCVVEKASVAVMVENAENVHVCENDLNYPAEFGAVFSGAEAAKFYNNIIRGEGAIKAGVTLRANTRNSLLWNNVVTVLDNTGEPAAFEYAGAVDCRLYNNIVVGGYTAVRFAAAEGETTNLNPVLKNNIFMNCTFDAYQTEVTPQEMVSDYNMFYKTYPKMMEPNSRFGNPWFVDPYRDWRISADSSAAGNGAVLALEEPGIDFTDRYGTVRSGAWDIGAFQAAVTNLNKEDMNNLSDGSVKEDFSAAPMDWAGVRGIWEVHDNVYMNTTTTGRNSALYRKSLDWTDFEYSADLRTPKVTKTACTGLIFRADEAMKNQYAIRFFANQTLEFVLWRDDTFESLAQFPLVTEPDEVYNLKVKAEGANFTFYVNGKEVGTASDSSYASGAIGLYAYQQMYEYDNIEARPIR